MNLLIIQLFVITHTTLAVFRCHKIMMSERNNIKQRATKQFILDMCGHWTKHCISRREIKQLMLDGCAHSTKQQINIGRTNNWMLYKCPHRTIILKPGTRVECLWRDPFIPANIWGQGVFYRISDKISQCEWWDRKGLFIFL